MSYSVEWMGGGVVPVFGIVLVLLVLPQLAAIAVIVATIAVLIGLLVLAAAALASPYLLVRSVCRRLCPARNTMDALAERGPRADRPRDRLRVVGGAHVTAFTHDEPDEADAILDDATRDAA
jgi:ribosomal protein L40E